MPWVMVVLALTAQVSPATEQSLDRVREKLASPPPRLVVPAEPTDDDKRPKFRLSIEAVRPLYLNPPWEADNVIPLYVRSSRPLSHHEFLMMVTPEEFRASTLYPGADLLEPLARAIAGEMREIRERRAREEVRRQLALFKAANGIP